MGPSWPSCTPIPVPPSTVPLHCPISWIPAPQAFSCIDQNRDGIICKSDLRETYSQLGEYSHPASPLH